MTRTRRLDGLHLLVAAACAWCATGVARAHAAAPPPPGDRPNFVFIVSDDQRFDTIHALGNKTIRTPNLDALVARGVYFDRAYAMGGNSAAVCAPSRAMILSGRAYQNTGANPFDLPGGLALLPQVLRAAGYETFGTGKWHSGRAAFARSFTGGSSIFFGGMGSHTELMVNDFDPSGTYPKQKRRRLRAFSSTEFASAAIDFIGGRDSSKPFFAYVAFTAPHDPRTPPERWRYDPESIELPLNYLPVHPFNNGELKIRDERLADWPRTPAVVQQNLADYYGMISQMDEQIGRIIAALDDAGLADNTVIVFASDQGLAIGSHGLMGKQNLYEHSTRTPVIIAGPGLERGLTHSEFAYLFDLLPTVCELAGVAPPDGIDGLSLAPALHGQPLTTRDSIFTAYANRQRAIRGERFKLIRYPKIARTQLFDLEADPFETNDLAGQDQYTDEINRLTDLLRAWQKQLGDDLPWTIEPLGMSKFNFEAARGRP
jgi:arylsulfatase A-like enzyme